MAGLGNPKQAGVLPTAPPEIRMKDVWNGGFIMGVLGDFIMAVFANPTSDHCQ